MGPTRQTAPADRPGCLARCMQVLVMLARGYEDVTVHYHPGARRLWLYHTGEPILVIQLNGRICIDNHGRFNPERRCLLNQALAVVGRTEYFESETPGDWLIVGGAYEGPGAMAIGPSGRVGLLLRWDALDES